MTKVSREPEKPSKIEPPSVPPPEALYDPFGNRWSKLSFPATGPPDSGTDFKTPGSPNIIDFDTFLKGFSRVLEGVLKWF